VNTFPVPKNNWQPTADSGILKKRAKIFARIRRFFEVRDVIEVETPLLSHGAVTDPHILSMKVSLSQPMYLQTSPEYAMKRLLCAGMGSIYQICKAFRLDEKGKKHNPEFTILEWYRIPFDHHDLMDEMDLFLQEILQTQKAERCTVADIFLKFLNINPHHASIDALEKCARDRHLSFKKNEDKNFWFDLLFSHCIEPHLGHERPLFLFDYPASQAALARVKGNNPPVASRFEVYFKGIELANGFHELSNAAEQRKRFQKDMVEREKKGIEVPALDENFLAALQHGLPDCAGVALGIDRLVMLALQCESISQVISFDFENA